MPEVEAEIAAMERQLEGLKRSGILLHPVSQDERNALRAEVFKCVKDERWWVWDPATNNDWQGKVSACFQTRNSSHAGPEVSAAETAIKQAVGPEAIARARRDRDNLKRQIDDDCRACLETARLNYDQAWQQSHP